MDLRPLRRRCEARLRELELPVPFDVRAFCDALARRRGRPILLRPVASGTGCYGLWVATPTEDIVFYEQETSPLHRDHIILHELCHLASGHRPVPASTAEIARLLLPDLRPELVHCLLQRSSYSSDDEREAELLASLILERSVGTAPAAAPVVDARTAAALGQLEATLQEGAS